MANTAPLTTSTPLVLTVHDVMYLFSPRELASTPSLYHRLGKRYRQQVVPAAAHKAVALTTVSEASRHDIAVRLGLDPQRIRVVHEAPNSACSITTDAVTATAVRDELGLVDAYFLALAASDPRKNTARIIRAFGEFTRQSVNPHQLALIGLRSSHQRTFRDLAAECGVGDRVVFTDFLPESDLVALYQGAAAFLYPSLYEGFGLPILEAMACETPVITSRRGALPEVSGEAALYVDPLDYASIARAMRQLTSDVNLRNRLVASGQANVSRFSWRSAAAAMLDVYASTLEQRRSGR
jgi:glycosyltransferase involved in cell wall biosynthesis